MNLPKAGWVAGCVQRKTHNETGITNGGVEKNKAPALSPYWEQLKQVAS